MNQIAVHDFSISCAKDTRTPQEIITWLNTFCKHWSFQKEEGSTGYVHYQGRISLLTKLRANTIITKHPILGKWSITSNENQNNDFYVTKEDSRLDGPWKDTDEVNYVPIQYRIKELYPWQQQIVNDSKKFHPREINIILNRSGNVGKSTLVGYMCCNRLARRIPALNNFKDIIQLVLAMPVAKCYLIDMPRAIRKDDLREFYSAIESIKDGHVFDTRYGYKERWFDSPSVYVFTNKIPAQEYLSRDRWKITEINRKEEGV